jgi:hypothetical protein
MGDRGQESTVPGGPSGGGEAGPGPAKAAAGQGRAEEPLVRAEELLERMRGRLETLEQQAEAGAADEAVDTLGEIAEIAKEIEAEITRARASADARS